MKYRLIAIDMDGTLLNSNNEISKRNLAALYKAREKGLHVVLNTGRILRSAFYYANSIELNNPVIACNGAIITCKDEEDIIYENKMSIETSKEIFKISDEFDMKYYFYNRDTFFAKELHDGVKKFYGNNGEAWTEQGIKVEVSEDITEIVGTEINEIYKFVFIEDDKNKLLHFREALKFIEGINISSSWHNNVEVMNKGVSKGEGLKQLCKKLNIDRSQVVAIGDNENDVSMFQVAGLAVAMENGEDIVKEYSHVITDTNDQDGVAKAIEKYVLNL